MTSASSACARGQHAQCRHVWQDPGDGTEQRCGCWCHRDEDDPSARAQALVVQFIDTTQIDMHPVDAVRLRDDIDTALRVAKGESA